MKILKQIGIGLLGLILLLLIISFFLPSHIRVERSMEMNSSSDKPYALINNLKDWNKWSPWAKIDPQTEWTFSDPAEGIGAWYTWKSNHGEVGNGKLTIIESTPEKIKMEMEFEGQGKSMAEFLFTPTENGTKVTWALDADMGMNPAKKLFGLLMDNMLGKMFTDGLTTMKTEAEAMPSSQAAKETIAGFDVEEKTIDKMMILSIREKVKSNEIGQKIGECFGMIGMYMGKNKLIQSSMPLTIWHKYGEKECDMEAAIPIAVETKSEGKVKYSELPATNAFVVKYFGAYEKVAPVYKEAYTYIESKGKKVSGAPREVYITDPGMEKDTAKWLTEIVFPVE